MKKSVSNTSLICDNCGHEKTWKTDEMFFGGHPSSGWVSVHIAHHSSVVTYMTQDENYDFCCKKCASEFLVKDSK